MVMATLPRVVGPGETVVLPVSVFALDRSVRNVTIKLETNELFTVVEGVQRQLVFSSIGDQMITFNLKVKEMTGVGKVKIVAVSGKEKAEHSIEIDVRNPNPPVTDVMEKVIQPGSSWSAEYMPVGIPGTNKGILEFSSIPPLNLEKRLEFLIHYPYGCIEQTTSSVFPQLYLSDIMDLSPESKQKTEQNIKAAIQRLKSFQLSNGGLSYWPGSHYADDWGTCYAGHFLLEAEQKGFALPIGFLSSWKEFQRQKAVSWFYNSGYYNDDLIQAYRLYTLALAKAPELGAMNKLLEQKNLSVSARWRLAAAYQLAGKNEAASNLVASATMAITPYKELYFTYGSDLRDKAMIVEALCLLNMKTKAAPLIKEISADLCDQQWYSTQTTAFALLSISKFIGNTSGTGINATFRSNTDQPVKVESTKPVITSPVDPKPGHKGLLKVTNNGKNLLFARLILIGVPAKGDSTEASNNLKLKVVFKSLKDEIISTQSLQQGTSFIAEVTVTNPGIRGIYRQMALSQIFPSGWEIINARNSEMAQASTTASSFDYQDVRDDRVYTYFEIAPNQYKTFRILLMATYLGRFYLPATSCEAMYDNTISARVPGRWVEVASSLRFSQ